MRNENGFTLAELLVAMMITMVVLGGAVMMTSQVQQSFRRQIEDSAGEQEGRYALDWVSKLIRAAGNNPFDLPPVVGGTANCPVAGTPYTWVSINPLGHATNDNIRVQMDSNPPDGILGGPGCTQSNEDMTVAYDPLTSSITFEDNNTGGGVETVRTDAVIDGLLFVFKDVNHLPTVNALNVVYVETQVTVRTRTIDPATMRPETRLLTQEVRLRGRNF
ncbi:MAG TPA: prepilin-type N-terminal cleavage/methylation domain-containing protein [Vicinamibacterales bacterium]|nr:prepilin-type N-terminal cleavage/methylation domain-containing protein [Vicinamibacterales bacterium]